MNCLKKGRKGFVVTLAAIGLMVALLYFASTLSSYFNKLERVESEVQRIEFAGVFFDNVADDLMNLSRANFAVERNSSSDANISFAGSIPQANQAANFSNYSLFVSSNLSDYFNANVSANFSNLSDGSFEIFFSNQLQFKHSYAGNNEILFANQSLNGNTGTTRYIINITVNADRDTLSGWSWSPTGDLNVTLCYADNDGTINDNGLLDSNAGNEYSIAYAGGGELEFLVGKRGALGTGKGIFWMKESGLNNVRYNFTVFVPAKANETLSAYLPVQLNYAQANVSKNGFIEVQRV